VDGLEPLLPRHPRLGHRWHDHRLVIKLRPLAHRAGVI
jgi:hypothetical protein